MEKWTLYAKKADFAAIGRQYGIDPVIARVIRNREVKEAEEIRLFLRGSKKDFFDPHLLKDADLLTDILLEKMKQKAKIRVVGDYDIDGVVSSFILKKGLQNLGTQVTVKIPDRIIDGYGLNENIIRQAYQDGVDTILTCDNGIAALSEIALAKELGMTVLITDHHEIPFDLVEGQKVEKVSAADAVVNAHQQACPYPNKNLCGASVAWKVIQILYEKTGYGVEKADDFMEFVALATVGDVMELQGENRIFVKEGLKQIQQTKNIGMQALIRQCQLEDKEITTYHFGFVLGPCINATGRLDTADRALALFMAETEEEASLLAQELVILNQQRKDMTEKAIQAAKEIYESGNYAKEKVTAIYLPGISESIAGIVAGRIREAYHKPTYIMTDAASGIKGSGRSTETYNMYEELCKCSEFMTKFGGHPMAAGFSLEKDQLEAFCQALCQRCQLTEEELAEKVYIDAAMPMDYVTMELVDQFRILEPCGKGNERPHFAQKHLRIGQMKVLGKDRKILRLTLLTDGGYPCQAVYFGDYAKMLDYLTEKFGQDQVDQALRGQTNTIDLAVVYYPQINHFRDTDSLQFVIERYC